MDRDRRNADYVRKNYPHRNCRLGQYLVHLEAGRSVLSLYVIGMPRLKVVPEARVAVSFMRTQRLLKIRRLFRFMLPITILEYSCDGVQGALGVVHVHLGRRSYLTQPFVGSVCSKANQRREIVFLMLSFNSWVVVTNIVHRFFLVSLHLLRLLMFCFWYEIFIDYRHR